MRQAMVALVCALSLGACQTRSAADTGDQEVVVHPGDAMVSVVGTPFYLAFKGVVCLASAVVAAPTAAVLAASDDRLAPEALRDLGDGMRQNCGPPYALSPYRVVSAKPPSEYPREPTPEPPPAVDPEPAAIKGPKALFPEHKPHEVGEAGP